MADKSLAELALAELISAGHGGGPACTAFLKSMAPPEAPKADTASAAGTPTAGTVAATP